MMKIYLILLAISFVSYLIIDFEIIVYIKKHYSRIAKSPVEKRVLGHIKTLIMILLIFPNIIALLSILFAHDTFIRSVDKVLSKSGRFEKKANIY